MPNDRDYLVTQARAGFRANRGIDALKRALRDVPDDGKRRVVTFTRRGEGIECTLMLVNEMGQILATDSIRATSLPDD